MSDQSSQSSHPLLSCTDGIATSTADVILLVGRVLLGWISSRKRMGKALEHRRLRGLPEELGAPAPELSAWIGAVVELVIGVTLILGLATRYGALLCALFLIIATALAHRYWEYPAAQAGNQYNHFLKNLAIFGGALVLFVTGPGRLSIDRMLSKKG